MTKFNGIKAVSFDVDGTLWDFEGTARFALGQVLVELRRLDPQAAGILDVDTFGQIRDRVHEDLRGEVVDLNKVRLESFRQALRDVGRPNDALGSHLCDVYMKHRDAGRRPFPDVVPALRRLGRRFTLGLISNGNSYAHDLGLGDLLSFGVFSQDHGGIEKPDSRLFETALAEAGCSPEQLLHVGDSLENDIAGARNAGIRSIWLNRNGDSASPDVEPDAEIASLRELVETLE